MSIRSHISKTTCPDFIKFSVHVARAHALIWRQCNTLCTSGFVDDVMFSHRRGENGRMLKVAHRGSIGGEIWCLRLRRFCHWHLQVFIDVLSRAFFSCNRDSKSCNSTSPGGSNVVLKHSPGDDKSTAEAAPGESNRREWNVLITVLDRVCFTASVTAVVVAILIFFPRWFLRYGLLLRLSHIPWSDCRARSPSWSSYRADFFAWAELSIGPFSVTRSNPTHQLTDPTQPNQVKKIRTQPDPTNTTNNGAYSLAATYFYMHNLSRTCSQPSINLFVFFTE